MSEASGAPGLGPARHGVPSGAPSGRAGDRPTPALDCAVARMAGRLAGVLDSVGGDAPAVAFLRSHAARAPRGAPVDGCCLDLPRPGGDDPADRLVAALRPTPVEVDLLVLAATAHHHEGLASILRGLHPERRPWPTVGLAGLLAEHGALGAGPAPPTVASGHGVEGRATVRDLLTCGALVRAGVLAVEGDGPFSERTLTLAPLLWEALMAPAPAPAPAPAAVPTPGDVGTGPAGAPWPPGVIVDRRPTPAAGLEGWMASREVRAAGAAIEQGAEVAVVATADRPGAVAGRLAALVTAAGHRSVTLQVPVLDDALARRVLLLSLAHGAIPVLWTDRPAAGPVPAAGLPVPLVLAVPAHGGTHRDPTAPPGSQATNDGTLDAWPRPVLTVPAGPLDRDGRRRAIVAALPGVDLPPHPIGPATLEPCDAAVAAADLRAAAGLGGGPVDLPRLVAAVDGRTAAAVPAGAVLVHPTATWSDLVLPGDRARQLREAVDRVLARATVFDEWGFSQGRAGRDGLRLLLCGPPGTGKSLAAEVIAGELGRDLLVVDLSRMVSKWIGETEKNLAVAFDAAERGGAVLLFDEADALFGKRTEVGDARDRYANLETAYLLSRLERFSGVAVLATNLRQNLDAAFARRIEFIVLFDPPDQAARAELWRRHLPASAPVAPSVDVDRLAALYDLPGALIRNAAVAAAFLAASEPGGPVPITVQHVVHAIRREYAKAGQAFPGVPAGVGGNGSEHPGRPIAPSWGAVPAVIR